MYIFFGYSVKVQFNIIILIFVFSFLSFNSFCQKESSDLMPKQIGAIKLINNLIGWAKDDSSRWYRFNETTQDNLQVDNIQVSQIEYKGKKYWGVLSCGWRRDSKKQTDKIEYVTRYWIFDSTIVKEPTYLDTSVHTNIFKVTMTSGEIIDLKPVLWTAVLNEFRQCFHNGICLDKGRLFFIKYSYCHKAGKVQFYLGGVLNPFKAIGIMPDIYEVDFTDGRFVAVGDYFPEQNRDLGVAYFEAEVPAFEKAFSDLIK